MDHEKIAKTTNCDNCKTNVNNNDDAIECEHCKLWQHFECSGLTKGEFDVMKRRNCKLTWLCSDCKHKLLKMTDIEERVTGKLTTQMQVIMESMMDGIQEAIKQGIKAATDIKAKQRVYNPLAKRAPLPPDSQAKKTNESTGNNTPNIPEANQMLSQEGTNEGHIKPCESQSHQEPNTTWTEVVKRRAHNIIGTNENNTQMKAAPRKAWLFVGRLHEETKTEDVIAHLQANNIKEEIICEEIETKGRTKAFKIGLNFDDLEKTNDPNLWPRNVIVRRYRFPRLEPGLLPTVRLNGNSQ